MSNLLMADFSNARVGERVKCLVFGDGVICNIRDVDDYYRLSVKFKNTNFSYSIDGKMSKDSQYILFYHFDTQFPTKEACTRPLLKIEVDEKVYVWSRLMKDWFRHYADGLNKDGTIRIYPDGKTNWTAGDLISGGEYKYWKLASDETINSGNLDEIGDNCE